MDIHWEVCFVRSSVIAGAEVIFFHPLAEKCKIYRFLKEFLAERHSKSGMLERSLEVRAISLLLADGWEPMGVGSGGGPWTTGFPHVGATGYAFRRPVTLQ